MTVHDRAWEVDALETAYESPGHDCYVVYGARHVGNTELMSVRNLASPASGIWIEMQSFKSVEAT